MLSFYRERACVIMERIHTGKHCHRGRERQRSLSLPSFEPLIKQCLKPAEPQGLSPELVGIGFPSFTTKRDLSDRGIIVEMEGCVGTEIPQSEKVPEKASF